MDVCAKISLGACRVNPVKRVAIPRGHALQPGDTEDNYKSPLVEVHTTEGAAIDSTK
jgi:hypothetical protein